ncbi:hypothetical protein [Pelistega indica]|nr:hypothetical protein [Pelistega indica]
MPHGINGCIYCVSVYAQRFEQLARCNEISEYIYDNPAMASDSE